MNPMYAVLGEQEAAPNPDKQRPGRGSLIVVVAVDDNVAVYVDEWGQISRAYTRDLRILGTAVDWTVNSLAAHTEVTV